MTIALLCASLPTVWYVQAADGGNGSYGSYEYSRGYNSPGDKALKKRSNEGDVSIPTPPLQKSSKLNLRGEVNGTHFAFIIPVSHKKTVPEGFEAITSFADFAKINADPSGNYILMGGDADGNFSMRNAPFEPMGTLAAPFTGVFDGNGYVIEGLNIASVDANTYAVGLFGVINGATIKNLGISGDLVINVRYANVGKYIQSAGSIAGISVGSVIDNCFNKGDVVNIYDNERDYSSSTPWKQKDIIDAGGIVGSTWNTVVSNSYNGATAAIGMNEDSIGFAQTAGGIIGGSYFAGAQREDDDVSTKLFSVIENCYNEGPITGEDDAGGIVGEIFGNVLKSYNSGYVYGYNYAGGLVGNGSNSNFRLDDDGKFDKERPLPGNKIENSYNTGEVKTDDGVMGAGFAGGLVGLMVTLSIENSYNYNSINTDSKHYGGLVASNRNEWNHNYVGEITNCYYPEAFANYVSDILPSGEDAANPMQFVVVNNAAKLSDPQMKQKLSFVGFNFSGIWDIKPTETPTLRVLAHDYIRFSGTVYGSDADYTTPRNRYGVEAEVSIKVYGADSDTPYEIRTTSDADGKFMTWILPSDATVSASASGFNTYSYQEVYGNPDREFKPNNDPAKDEEEKRYIEGYEIYLNRGIEPPPNLTLKGTTVYIDTKINQITGEIETTTPRPVGGVDIDVESYYEKDGKLLPFVWSTQSSYAGHSGKGSSFTARFFAGDVKITARKDGFRPVYIHLVLEKSYPGLEIVLETMFEDIFFPLEINRIQPTASGAGGEKVKVQDSEEFGFALINTSPKGGKLVYKENYEISAEIIKRVTLFNKDGVQVGETYEYGDLYLAIYGRSVRTEIQRGVYIDGPISAGIPNADTEEEAKGDDLQLIVKDITGKLATRNSEKSAYFEFTRDPNKAAKIKLTFDFLSQGTWESNIFADDSGFDKGIALVFDSTGKFLNRFVPIANQFTGKQLKEGQYSVAFIENYQNLREVPNISELKKDNAYAFVERTIEITDGKISQVALTDKLPAIDADTLYVVPPTSLKLDKPRGYLDMQVTATIDFAIDKSFLVFASQNKTVSVDIDLTDKLGLYNDYVKLNDTVLSTSEFKRDGQKITVEVPVSAPENDKTADWKIGGTIQVYAIVYDAGIHGISSTVNFKRDDGKDISRPIGSKEYEAYEVDITNLPKDPPTWTTEDYYTVEGTGHPGSNVTVYVDGVEERLSVKVGSNGKWSKTIMLGVDAATTEYKIYAVGRNKARTEEYVLIHEVERQITAIETISVSAGSYLGEYNIVMTQDGWLDYDYSDFRVGEYQAWTGNGETGYEWRTYKDDYTGLYYGSYDEYPHYVDKYLEFNDDTDYYITKGRISFDYTNPNDRGYKTLYPAENVPYTFDVKFLDDGELQADKVWVYVKDARNRDLAVVELVWNGTEWTAKEDFGAYYNNEHGYKSYNSTGLHLSPAEYLNNAYSTGEVDRIYVKYGNAANSNYIDSQYCFINAYLDPSGYVYEAVETNRVSDVEVTLWTQGVEDGFLDGNVSLWSDTSENPQENPLITGPDGYYEWAVGNGAYLVEYKKDGYETRTNNAKADGTSIADNSGKHWLIVPPPQTDVNVGLVSTATPVVSGATGVNNFGSNEVEVTFSQYMDITTLNKTNLTVKVDGKALSDFAIGFPDAEGAAPDDRISTDRIYARTILIYLTDEAGTAILGGFESGSVVEITISGAVKNYADKAMGSENKQTVNINGEPIPPTEVEIVLPANEGLAFKTEGSVEYLTGLNSASSIKFAADVKSLVVDRAGVTVEVVNKDGAAIANTARVGTGAKLIIKEAGAVVREITIVVKYDVTGTGTVALADIFSALDYAVGNVVYSDGQLLAIGTEKKGLALIFDMLDYAVNN